MKKSLLAMTALAAMLFAGCTSSDEITTLESIKQADNVATPISFGTYMGKTGTRATVGKKRGINTSVLQTTGSGEGFGVFAYYTGNNDYNSTTAPNFMYNQNVYYNGTNWTYSPVKYWPNDNTGADNSGATGTTTSKVSFFAYAPYVVNAGNPASDDGIIN